MSLAIYRKYRPHTLDDIVGQKNITTILKNTAIQDKFAHAYLFYGPRGTGKTSVARIISKLANCETRQNDKDFQKKGIPCNKCSSCISIDNSNSLDVMEIDAASTRGIDDIRDLQNNIMTAPSSSPYKIVIMDEVHMLTSQAFNALLKTIEEPPSHVIFILATTEYEKVPKTIISRTQKFNFERVLFKDITSKLKDIVKKEGIEAEKGAIEMIARLANGSMRDAESMLDQISSLKGKITQNIIEDVLGKVSFVRVAKMAKYIISKDLQKTIEFLYEIESQGYNVLEFNKDLIEYVRRTLSLSLNPELEKMFLENIAKSEIDSIKDNIKIADTSFLILLLKSLLASQAQMKYSPIPIIPMEVAIISSLKKTTK